MTYKNIEVNNWKRTLKNVYWSENILLHQQLENYTIRNARLWRGIIKGMYVLSDNESYDVSFRSNWGVKSKRYLFKFKIKHSGGHKFNLLRKDGMEIERYNQ